jgi:hypothetical protein
MKSNNLTDDERARRIAGIASITAGVAWIIWIIINGMTNGGLDLGSPAINLRLAKLGQLLTVAWNLLLIPAVLVFWNDLRFQNTNLIFIYSICGILSQVFWAIGAAAHINSPMLEVTYLLLSGVWWLGIGIAQRDHAKWFGTFTAMLGVFALLDATLSFFEPMPFYIYVLAAPKLPLSIIWDFWLGIFMLNTASRSVS